MVSPEPAQAEMYPIPFIHIKEDEFNLLKPALEYDVVGLDKLISELQTGRALFWKLEANDAIGVCVTNMNDTIGGRELIIWLAAGVGPHAYKELVLKTLMEYGKRNGCVRMITQTTPSLAEYYQKTMDFKLDGVCISKEIPNG